MPYVLLLTGTCGSGKSTIAAQLGSSPGWLHLSEDPVWKGLFGNDRSPFGSSAHRAKRQRVQAVIVGEIQAALAKGCNVALDATVHQAPPEAYGEYKDQFDAIGVQWALRILHPRLEIAIARDAQRAGWRAGAERVGSLYAKFSGTAFPSSWFIDTSADSVEQTVARLLLVGVG